jgi:hypothetical protein
LYYPIQSIHDVDNGNATGAWKIEIISTGMEYDIENIVNNVIILSDNGTLNNTSATNLGYKLLDDNSNVIFESNNGIYNVEKRGRVVVDPSSGIGDIKTYFVYSLNNYFYFDSTSLQYKIDGYPDINNQFYIDEYDSGDQSGVSGKVLQRLVYNTGNLNYDKMLITKPLTFPAFTDPNDPNALRNSTFKENYLIKINSTYFYSIVSEINISGTDYLIISGRFEDWGTITSGGTPINYELIQYVENSVTILNNNLPFVDRSNNELITYNVENTTPFAMADFANGPKSVSIQEETIGYTILTRDNKKIEGKI